MVTCQICGKEFTTISHHVKVKHGIHIDEYRKLYPGFETSDKNWLTERNLKIKETCSTPEFRSTMSQISSEFNGSPEGHKLLSDRMKLQSQDPEFRKLSQEAIKKKYEDPEERFKRSEDLSRRAKAQWERDYDNLSRRVGPHKWTSKVSGKVYRSYAEMCLADQLTYSDIEFEYEPRYFGYYCSEKCKVRRYYPDFFINDLRLFVEVKYTENDIGQTVVEKLKAVKSEGFDIIVVYHNEIVKSPSITSFILDKNLDQFIDRTNEYLR